MDGLMTSTSFERPRTIWTPSMDRFFIDLVIQQVRRGNMIDHAFRKQVWVRMTALFNRKFGYQYEKDVLKNRYKSLRRKYNEITAILNQKGFQWDAIRQMVVADDNVWDDYIKGHSEKRSYRTKILPYYSDLCIIYGNAPANRTQNQFVNNENFSGDSSRTNSAQASGNLQSPQTDFADRGLDEDAQESSQSEQDMALRSTNMAAEPCEITDRGIENNGCEGLVPVEVTFEIEAVPGISDNRREDHPSQTAAIKDDMQVMRNGGSSQGLPSPSTPISFSDLISDEQEDSSYLGGDLDKSNNLNKRLFSAPSASEHFKRLRKGNDGSMMDALREMATTIKSLKDNKKVNNKSISIEDLMDALQAVPDIDEDLLLDACDFLEDEKKAKTFLALDVRLRKKWLIRKLRSAA